MSIRFDKGTLEVLESRDGFLRARVTIAKTGVFPYIRNGKMRREAKLPEELFSPVTIESAKLKPVIEDHPPLSDNGGLLNSENYRKYVKGSLGDSIEVSDETYLVANETVFDKSLIESLAKGDKREVSIGFECTIDETPGTFNGEPYDVIQRNILINHIAHVANGRAGGEVRAHLDSLDISYQTIEEAIMPTTKEVKKDSSDATQVPAGQSPPANSQAENWLTQFFQKLMSMTSSPSPSAETVDAPKPNEMDSLKAQIDALTKENADLKKRLNPSTDKADQKPVQDSNEEIISKRTNERMKLVETAKAVIKDFKHDGLTDREIRTHVIKAITPNVEIKQDWSDDLVTVAFDTSVSVAKDKFFMDKKNDFFPTLDEAEIEKMRYARIDMRGGQK